MKVDIGLLCRRVILKLEEVRLYATTGGARRGSCASVVARRVLRVRTVGLCLDCCVWCVTRLIPGREERACIGLNASSKYAR
jgi:hypothetical protein